MHITEGTSSALLEHSLQLSMQSSSALTSPSAGDIDCWPRGTLLTRSSHKGAPGGWSNNDLPGPCAEAREVTSVQQPCSNPSKSPETLRNAPMVKYGNLQAFCKLQKPLAKYLCAFARRRSGVRIPSTPLQEYRYLQVKYRNKGVPRKPRDRSYCNRTATCVNSTPLEVHEPLRPACWVARVSKCPG